MSDQEMILTAVKTQLLETLAHFQKELANVDKQLNIIKGKRDEDKS